MTRLERGLPLALLFLLSGTALGVAQFGFWGGRAVMQNDPPPTELVVARLKFGTNGDIGGMGWAHNYPDAEMNLNQFIGQATRIEVQRVSYRIVELGSDDLFKHPFVLISEPGEMDLSTREIEQLREYIARGGFIVVDDFDGAWQLDNFRRQLALVFPDRTLEEMQIHHPVFNTFYQIESLTTFEPYVPGDTPVFYSLADQNNRRLVLVACHNNDLMNFWDWIGQARYPLRPATEAFRVGTNFLMYALTH
jgi:hypothetical protein